MKKIFAVLLAFLMIVSLCTSVVSANGLGDSSADVYIKVDDEGSTIHKYSVDIEFGDMHFVYGASAVWDSETHDYYVSDDAVWAPEAQNSDKIRIFNHSDLPIKYSTAFDEISEQYGAIALAASPESGELERCPVQATSAPMQTLTVTLSGTPETFTNGFVSLAKVIVTIEPIT